MLVAQDFGGDNHVKIDKNAINLRHVNDYFQPFLVDDNVMTRKICWH